MFKKNLSILTVLFFIFITSCGDTLSSVKRGLTGAKANSADEFLIQKKDPLILPPDFENLPTPDQSVISETEEEISAFEKSLETSIEEDSSEPSSVEESILKKIKRK